MNNARKNDNSIGSPATGTTGIGPFSTPQGASTLGKSQEDQAKDRAKLQKKPSSGSKPPTRRPKQTGRPIGHPLGTGNIKENADQIIEREKWFEDDDDSPFGPNYNDIGKLPQDDPRINYDPIGGMTGAGKACANCQWFIVQGSMCRIVEGAISPTGLSDLWLERESGDGDFDLDDMEPIPVRIVAGEQAADPAKIAAKEESAPLVPRSKTLLEQIKEALGFKPPIERLEFEAEQGFKALDNGRWIAWWSNNFEDKHEEIFSEKAHDRYVERVDSSTMEMPELWYRHIPVATGRADWVGRVDHLMLATGYFYDTETGRKFYDHYRNTKQEYTVSHGYLYLKDGLRDGVYEDYYTYEISPLPRGEEANEITGFGVKEMTKPISAEKRKDLEDKIGPELAARWLQYGEEKSKELEAMGLKFKEAGEKAAPTAPADDVSGMAISAIALDQKSLGEGFKAMTDTLKVMTQSIKEMSEARVKERQEIDGRLSKMEKFLEDNFRLQSRATNDPATVISTANPYLNLLGKRELEQDPEQQKYGGILGQIVDMATKQAGS